MLFLKILKFISLLFSPQNLTLIILLNIEQGIKMMFSKTQTILQIPLTMNQKTIPKKAKKANNIVVVFSFGQIIYRILPGKTNHKKLITNI